MAWNDLATERPVIATMASVSYGTIPRSKIKAYAEDDLGLVGEEVDMFISIMRRVERKSSEKQAEPEAIKKIVNGLAAPKDGPGFQKKKMPRVRHPRP